MKLKLIIFLMSSVVLNLSAGSTGSKSVVTVGNLVEARKAITTAEAAIAKLSKRNMVKPEHRIALELSLKQYLSVWRNLSVADRMQVAYSESAGMVNKKSKLLPGKLAKPLRKQAAVIYAEIRASQTAV